MNLVKLPPPIVAMKMPRATAVDEKTPMIVSADWLERLRTNENSSANATASPTAHQIGSAAPQSTPMAIPVKPEWPSASEKKLILPVTIIVESRPKSGAMTMTASSAFFMKFIDKNSAPSASQRAYQRVIPRHLPCGTRGRTRPSSKRPAEFLS